MKGMDFRLWCIHFQLPIKHTAQQTKQLMLSKSSTLAPMGKHLPNKQVIKEIQNFLITNVRRKIENEVNKQVFKYLSSLSTSPDPHLAKVV